VKSPRLLSGRVLGRVLRRVDGGGARRPRRWLAATAATLSLVAWTPLPKVATAAADPGYRATIVQTAYGIPHITADDFGSLGFGYGVAFAGDDLCTMAEDYVTVEGQRSRFFGPDGTYTSTGGSTADNLDSDFFWQSVIDSRAVPKLLAVRSGPSAVQPALRQLITGYVDGYNHYLASVGGSAGVPDPTCRGKAWVRPITELDAYLRMYQIVDLEGQAADPDAIATAQPPAVAPPAPPSTTAPASPTSPAARAKTMASAAPGTHGLPTTAQLKVLASRVSTVGSAKAGSNAIAVGSAGTRNHSGMLLGNPHFPWDGADRFYEVQLTIPGVMNVEGASLDGLPLVVIGFNSSVAWSHTTSTSFPFTFYQLALLPGHPTEYVYDGRAQAMTPQAVTVMEQSPRGGLQTVRRTLWSTRWGPVTSDMYGQPLPWSTGSAFVLADADADNFRFLDDVLATDRATSTATVLAGLKEYQGMPWSNTVAADSAGHALYADIGSFPDVTDAEAERCDTAIGAVVFQQGGPPILDGSQPSCAWGSDPDSAAPGIFGGNEEPSLTRSDFVENSNDSFWLSNPAQPLTGYPRILGDTDTDRGLRTRSALTMVTQRISGTDDLGPAGFTLQDMKDLMFSEIQYGATLVKPQLVSFCRSLPGGLAPTSSGATVPVGDACDVLAAWNGREDVGSRGDVLFRDFWERALALPEGPWSTPFDPADPVGTPNGLNTADHAVQTAFGDALADLTAAHLPYDVTLGSVQYVVRDGERIPLPGGPGDPDGEFDAIYQNVMTQPGADPSLGSSYLQAVTWAPGNPCPDAAALLTYSESDNPDSPHHTDQTVLFSQQKWATAYFCPAQVAAHAVSTTVVHGS